MPEKKEKSKIKGKKIILLTIPVKNGKTNKYFLLPVSPIWANGRSAGNKLLNQPKAYILGDIIYLFLKFT